MVDVGVGAGGRMGTEAGRWRAVVGIESGGAGKGRE